ncbi:hypothetical protein AZA_88770 [Nitrospirillum viridazoti Y2]|nr:hypothetical protein AZA_88770 [Nitrospirillum amazonense Y2]
MRARSKASSLALSSGMSPAFALASSVWICDIAASTATRARACRSSIRVRLEVATVTAPSAASAITASSGMSRMRPLMPRSDFRNDIGYHQPERGPERGPEKGGCGLTPPL